MCGSNWSVRLLTSTVVVVVHFKCITLFHKVEQLFMRSAGLSTLASLLNEPPLIRNRRRHTSLAILFKYGEPLLGLRLSTWGCVLLASLFLRITAGAPRLKQSRRRQPTAIGCLVAYRYVACLSHAPLALYTLASMYGLD